jgi:hypothetical protein
MQIAILVSNKLYLLLLSKRSNVLFYLTVQMAKLIQERLENGSKMRG